MYTIFNHIHGFNEMFKILNQHFYTRFVRLSLILLTLHTNSPSEVRYKTKLVISRLLIALRVKIDIKSGIKGL